MSLNIITRLIVGLIAGFLADKLVKNTYGMFGDMLIGVAGSFLGGWLFSIILPTVENDVFLVQVLVSLIGAVILLVVINAFKRRKQV